jgi:hypothetical protein
MYEKVELAIAGGVRYGVQRARRCAAGAYELGFSLGPCGVEVFAEFKPCVAQLRQL